MLDELGHLPFARSRGQLPFHLIGKLNDRTNVIITANLMADRVRRSQDDHGALLDRVTHHCDIVETGNDSWRFKNRS
ncbi:ATP-binding protein [Sphingopyxis terrae]|uniref:ATP-binding protein n=1 Tax=Sphingopyxis terrae TaxID=33052 RepID=UPI002A0E0198|nr:ATP-binding protein [Sphingopyxis terrae]MDX8356516.1 ATP-binding protein [Sphingopyxis terrae]